jgi:hypothetical protein
VPVGSVVVVMRVLVLSSTRGLVAGRCGYLQDNPTEEQAKQAAS